MTRLICSAIIVLGLVSGFAATGQDEPPEAGQEDTKPDRRDLFYKRELSWSEVLSKITREKGTGGFGEIRAEDISGMITIRVTNGSIASWTVFSALVLDDGRYRIFKLGSGEITGRIKPEDYVALEKRVRALDERPCGSAFLFSGASGGTYYNVYTRTEPHSRENLMSGEIGKLGCNRLKDIDPEIARILSLDDLKRHR